VYYFWKFHQGFKKWRGFSYEQRTKNWKTIKRFVQGVVVGIVIATGVVYALNWEGIVTQHHLNHGHDMFHDVPHS
jgi:riboflavin transporter FmnP